MTDYQSTLLGRTEVAKGTMAFQFDKPNNFVFKAGQYINLTLSGSQPQVGPSDGMTHTFSIVSSPSDEEILVTTRMRDTVFKRALSSLPAGSGVRIEGPIGSFSLHNNTSRPAVFLAGGIGIAPFLSMLSYATQEKLRHPIVLFYANRYLEDAAFIDAHISSEMLFAHVGDLQGPIYYIAGPPTMVAAARRSLSEVGVDEDDIRTEEFSGY